MPTSPWVSVRRPSHPNKGKQQQRDRDRRKLREKRRSSGVVHMPSTEMSVSRTYRPSLVVVVVAGRRRCARGYRSVMWEMYLTAITLWSEVMTE